MLKSIVAAIALSAAPGILWSEPIKYLAKFNATGTLTEADGTTVPFAGSVVLSISGDTTKVHKVIEDGEFEGYVTLAPMTIFIEGLGAMKSLIEVEAYSVEDSLELTGYVDEILQPTFVFSYSGFYNLQTAYNSQGSWSVNYFNMGAIPTNRGTLQFSDATSAGGFVGSLPD